MLPQEPSCDQPLQTPSLSTPKASQTMEPEPRRYACPTCSFMASFVGYQCPRCKTVVPTSTTDFRKQKSLQVPHSYRIASQTPSPSVDAASLDKVYDGWRHGRHIDSLFLKSTQNIKDDNDEMRTRPTWVDGIEVLRGEERIPALTLTGPEGSKAVMDIRSWMALKQQCPKGGLLEVAVTPWEKMTSRRKCDENCECINCLEASEMNIYAMEKFGAIEDDGDGDEKKDDAAEEEFAMWTASLPWLSLSGNKRKRDEGDRKDETEMDNPAKRQKM